MLCFLYWRSSVQGFQIRYCTSCVAVSKNPPMGILSQFKARQMYDCSSCTWHPCFAIGVNMLKMYKKLDAGSKNVIWLLPLSYIHLKSPRRSLKAVSSPLRGTYHKFHLWTSQSPKHPAVWFCGLCEQNVLVDPGGFPIPASKNWSWWSICILVECSIISSLLTTSSWICVNPIACCFWFMLLWVWRTYCNYALCILLLVTA